MSQIKLTEINFFQGMSDQPDCCSHCGARLDQIEIVVMDDECVHVCQCLGCHRVVGVVDMGYLDQFEEV